MSVVANVAINVDSRGAVSKLRQVADRSKELEKAAQGASTAVSKTGRELKTAANGMQYFIDATGRARKANGQFVTTAEAAAAGLKEQSRSASQAQRGFNGLIGSVGKLAAAYVTLNAAQSAVSAGIQRIESERRIQFLAKQYGEVDQLARAAANASDRFGQSQTTANKAVADIYARLRPVGVSLENIVSVYNGFNTAARISGATALEAESAFRQLSQALGSGALQGDEFRSISEQVPGILTAISQETGVAQSKLKKYAAEGKITADVVIAALQRIERDGADQLKEALGGPEQAIRDFQNAAEDVQVALTTAIVPEMARAFRDLAAIIEGLEPSLRFIGGLIADTLGSFRTLVDSVRGGPVVERLRQGGQLGFNVGQEKEQLRSFFGKERFAQLEQQARESAKAQSIPFAEALGERLRVAIKVQDRAKQIQAQPKRPTLPTRPVRIGDTVGDGNGGGGGRDRSAASIAKEQERAAEAAQRQAQAIAKGRLESEQLLERLNMQLAIEQEINPIKKIQLQSGLEQLEIQQRYGNLISQEEDSIRRINLERAGGLELQIANVRQTQDLVDKITDAGRAMGDFLANQIKVTETTDQYKQLWEGMSSAVANTFSSALDAAVDGTKNLGEALQGLAADLLKTIGKMLIMHGIAQALGALGGGSSNPQGVFSFLARGFGFRANGGPVSGGSPYIVGERGPELFVPSRSGSIVPNDRLGGGDNVSVVVNVDAKGTSVQGNDQEGNQLGRVLSAAVQAELIKQKRPGGLLA